MSANYNAQNEMTSGSANGSVSFSYDALGRCVKRTINGAASYFYYDGWSLIEEDNSAGAAQLVYVYGPATDELAAMWSASTSSWSWYHYDARGSVTHLTNASGQIVEQYSYSAFGVPSYFSSTAQPLNSSTVGNRFLFQGRDWIKELSLYDYRNRMYRPGIGRFLQPDPLSLDAGDQNIYRYCNNDPVNGNDPLGLGDLFSDGSNDSNDGTGSTTFFAPANSGASQAFSNWFYGLTPSSTSIFSFSSSSNFGFGLPLFAQLLGGGNQQGGATIANQNLTKANLPQRVLDRSDLRFVLDVANRNAERLVGLSQSDRIQGFEYSIDVAQNKISGARHVFPITRGEETSEKHVPMHGSPILYAQAAALGEGWHIVAHIYTAAHYLPYIMSQDYPKFDRSPKHYPVAGIMVSPGQGRDKYHLDYYNPFQ